MAYLKPKRVKCPVCEFSDDIRLVIGVGPHSEAGDIPYRRFNASGAFSVGFGPDGSKDGTLRCPNDGAIVWTNEAGKKANAT